MIFQDHLGFPYDFSGSHAVFGMIFRVTASQVAYFKYFRDQHRRFRALKRATRRFLNLASKGTDLIS